MKLWKRVSTVLAATVLAGSLAGTAIAANNDTTQGKIKINAGTLEVTIAGGDFGQVNYNFSYDPIVKIDEFVITVSDKRGTGAGWEFNIKGTNFSRTGGGEPFSIERLVLSNADAQVASGATGSEPASSFTTTTPITITTAPQSILKTKNTDEDGYGQGSYVIEYDGTLQIPDLTAEGEYTSTITIELAAGA